jgi:hypothetical protein
MSLDKIAEIQKKIRESLEGIAATLPEYEKRKGDYRTRYATEQKSKSNKKKEFVFDLSHFDQQSINNVPELRKWIYSGIRWLETEKSIEDLKSFLVKVKENASKKINSRDSTIKGFVAKIVKFVEECLIYRCAIMTKEITDAKELGSAKKGKHQILEAQLKNPNGSHEKVIVKPIVIQCDEIQVPVENFTARIKSLFDSDHTTFTKYALDRQGNIYGVFAGHLGKITSYHDYRTNEALIKGPFNRDVSSPSKEQKIVDMFCQKGIASVLVGAALCQDGDLHARNIGVAEGKDRCIAFDHGQSFAWTLLRWGIGGRWSQHPGWRIKEKYFLLTPETLARFPNVCYEEAEAGPFYHPTSSHLIGKASNKFSEKDARAFQALQHNPVFIKEAYFRFFMSIFVNDAILSACAAAEIDNPILRKQLLTAVQNSFASAKDAMLKTHRFRRMFLANYDKWEQMAENEFGGNSYYQSIWLKLHPGEKIQDFIAVTAKEFRGACQSKEQEYYRTKYLPLSQAKSKPTSEPEKKSRFQKQLERLTAAINEIEAAIYYNEIPFQNKKEKEEFKTNLQRIKNSFGLNPRTSTSSSTEQGTNSEVEKVRKELTNFFSPVKTLPQQRQGQGNAVDTKASSSSNSTKKKESAFKKKTKPPKQKLLDKGKEKVPGEVEKISDRINHTLGKGVMDNKTKEIYERTQLQAAVLQNVIPKMLPVVKRWKSQKLTFCGFWQETGWFFYNILAAILNDLAGHTVLAKKLSVTEVDTKLQALAKLDGKGKNKYYLCCQPEAGIPSDTKSPLIKN